jgi:hypothetical protein
MEKIYIIDVFHLMIKGHGHLILMMYYHALLMEMAFIFVIQATIVLTPMMRVSQLLTLKIIQPLTTV